MTERTLRTGRVVIVGPLSLILTVWACGGSSSSGLADGGSNLFGVGDDASGGSGSSSGGISSSGSSSGASGSSGSSGSTGGIGAASTCIVGTQGCFCDTTGACAPGLTCTGQPAPAPSVCCSGSNCAPVGGPIGSTCGKVTGAAMCMPGITILPVSGSNDGCGYPSSDFNESSIFCGITAVGGGAKPAVVSVFYSDEHALPLGCATSAFPVSPLSANPDAVSFPQTGDPACVDSFGRPLRPVLYVTDITADPTCTSGDEQKGGHPYDPVAVFGTWKSAMEGTGNQGTPNQADPTANGWSLGTSADAVPASVMSCNQGGGGPRGGGRGASFGTELRFEVGLVSGHSYRLQTIIHDGDQTRGGDSGEGCAVFCAGTGVPVCGPGTPTCGSGGSCPNGLLCGEDGCCYSTATPMGDGGGIVIP
jgi:hypothetical protein